MTRMRSQVRILYRPIRSPTNLNKLACFLWILRVFPFLRVVKFLQMPLSARRLARHIPTRCLLKVCIGVRVSEVMACGDFWTMTQPIANGCQRVPTVAVLRSPCRPEKLLQRGLGYLNRFDFERVKLVGKVVGQFLQ